MDVDVLETPAAFEAARSSWDQVYAADPEANLFLSWGWLSKWLPEVGDQWLILAARPTAAADYVGFFPLRWKTRVTSQGKFYSELQMAGGNFADYTGAVVHPAHAMAALDAFARWINARRFGLARLSKLRMRDDLHDRLVQSFSSRRFDVLLNHPMMDATGIDNAVCPFARLPSTWEGFLAGLSANMRQKLRRLLRHLDSAPDLRIEHANAQTIERSIEILIELWLRRWESRKADKTETIRDEMRIMLAHYWELGILSMPVLWQGPHPLGAHANLVDQQKHVMHFFAGARDDQCEEIQPGLLLHAHSIRNAIELGLTEYDFLRGNERYKYSFGAIERRIHNTIVRAKPGADQRTVFDPRSIPQALAQSARWRAEGEFDLAEAGYRQILIIDPACDAARHGCAEMKDARGRPRWRLPPHAGPVAAFADRGNERNSASAAALSASSSYPGRITPSDRRDAKPASHASVRLGRRPV
jgi:CelD/BcsL family acetyltransferase involved in cellulose biosynthesis